MFLRTHIQLPLHKSFDTISAADGWMLMTELRDCYTSSLLLARYAISGILPQILNSDCYVQSSDPLAPFLNKTYS